VETLWTTGARAVAKALWNKATVTLSWNGTEVLPLPLRFVLFPELVLHGPAEGSGWYWVGGKDCEVGIPIVKGLAPTPGVE